MPTNPVIIAAAKTVEPASLYRYKVLAAPQSVLDAHKLRKHLEYIAVDRALTWEEWVDARTAWCTEFKALLLEAPRPASTQALATIARSAAHHGYEYILLEEFT